jgi:uncharacterized protein YkwD
MSRRTIVAAVLCLAGSVPATAHACEGVDVAPAAAMDQATSAIVCLINAERTSRGLSALKPSAPLRVAALAHSRDMVARHFFDHISPSDTDPIQRVTATGWLRNTSDWEIGENLGYGAGAAATPRVLLAAWLQSPTHRENMLDPSHREIGVGIVSGTPRGTEGATYTTEFGMRKLRATRRTCTRTSAKTRSAKKKARSAKSCARAARSTR